MKERISWCLLIVALTSFGFADHDTWKKTWSRIPEAETKKIVHDIRKDGSFWALTSRALYYVSSEQSMSLVIRKNIEWISQDPQDPEIVYLAAEDGLFMRTENKIIQSVLRRHDCLSVVSSGERLFVGTKTGLVIRNAQDSWKTPSGKLATESVTLLASYGNLVYVVTPTSLYRYDPSSDQYKEIFSAGIRKESEIQVDEEEGTEMQSEILDLDIDGSAVYVATHDGILYTHNEGKDWQSLPQEGLPVESIQALSIRSQEPRFWAATDEGVYYLANERWVERYQGLHTTAVHDLAHDDTGNLYAATNRGFFILSDRDTNADTGPSTTAASPFKNYAELKDYFQDEPSVRDVQEMAVHYADVHPDKIKRWHRQSRLKAFVPSLSTGIDRSATDLIHWDTGPNPDVLTKGNDFIDWDVSLSWDLGDMVWSSDQTSIDSRSKLMVELREEVLDQVTRIYFERRRVQVALLSAAEDSELKLDDEMRLEELTAIIDGYTGGRFSQEVDERKKIVSGS